MYKLIKDEITNKIGCIFNATNNTFIPFVSANTDYRNFKKEINEETAQLQDADGNTMTAEDAKAYVATLP